MNNHEINQQGRKSVEAELLRRGAASVTSHGTRKIFLHATNSNESRTVELWIKTKRKGSWQTKSDEGRPADMPPDPGSVRKFWVFVDLAGEPRYWIVPDVWIRNDIYKVHQSYLNEHDGHRPRNDESNHHSIDEIRLEGWQDKWEILEIF